MTSHNPAPTSNDGKVTDPATDELSFRPESLTPNRMNLRRLIITETPHTEDKSEYTVGGYYGVTPGDVYNSKYVIIKKLGWGTFSVVWLATDKETNTCVALKFTRSATNYYANAEREIKRHQLLRKDGVNGANRVSTMLDWFEVSGESGTHLVMVFELLGPSLYDVMHLSNLEDFNLKHSKEIGRQLLEALVFLHDQCNTIHCDIHPNNMLFQISQEDNQRRNPLSPTYDSTQTSYELNFADPYANIQMKLADFGCSVDIGTKRYHPIQTCAFRAPEVFLGCGFDESADLWSVGCVLYTLVTGEYLFQCLPTDEFTDNQSHLSQMQEILGPLTRQAFETYYNKKWMNEYFDATGMLKSGVGYNPRALRKKIVENTSLSKDNIDDCVDLLSMLLQINPENRPSARQALSHQFLVPHVSGAGAQ